MEATAKLSSIRITPRKVGLLADEVRGRDINQALTYLQFSPRKRTALVLAKLIKSAAANAVQKGQGDVDQLMVKKLFVGPGPILKRFMPRAKGSAFPIMKRTSNITVIVATKTTKKK